ncbi:translation initiation factor [Halobaculum magnesiiphilum]|uniref:Translation initiation factor n=1 Tax=Halobaculum magnesiiphilum TaxID=1017351 RepID=A0A8T8WBY5_9EURY|nr:translation initiation factor [Halobaculum magnesiiphilum]QZP37367.1 translation initiation factor [Halobaculum magnesiiphilum]
MSDDDDPFAGIPDDPTADLDRADQTLSIRVERRTYDKPVTVIEGFDPDATDLADLASELKSAVGAGGTVDADAGVIEVQGDHADRVRDLLADRGFEVA